MKSAAEHEGDEPTGSAGARAYNPATVRWRSCSTCQRPRGLRRGRGRPTTPRLIEQDIVVQLQLQGFDVSAPEWQAFAGALAVRLLGFRRVAHDRGGVPDGRWPGERQRPLRAGQDPPGPRLDRDDAHAVATELVITSIAASRDKTLTNTDADKRWRAFGGASNKTFSLAGAS